MHSICLSSTRELYIICSTHPSAVLTPSTKGTPQGRLLGKAFGRSAQAPHPSTALTPSAQGTPMGDFTKKRIYRKEKNREKAAWFYERLSP